MLCSYKNYRVVCPNAGKSIPSPKKGSPLMQQHHKGSLFHFILEFSHQTA